MDVLVVGGVERAGFFRFERKTDVGSRPLFLVVWPEQSQSTFAPTKPQTAWICQNPAKESFVHPL